MDALSASMRLISWHRLQLNFFIKLFIIIYLLSFIYLFSYFFKLFIIYLFAKFLKAIKKKLSLSPMVILDELSVAVLNVILRPVSCLI